MLKYGSRKECLYTLKVLDRCFRDSRRRYYIEDLIEACNEELSNYDGSSVSERTIRDDISFMQRQAGGGIPLVKNMMGIKPITCILIEISPS